MAWIILTQLLKKKFLLYTLVFIMLIGKFVFLFTIKIISKLERFIGTLIIIFLIGSITVGPLVYKLWLNNKFDLSFIFLLIIIFDVSIYSLKSSLTILLSSLNKNFTINIVELIVIIIAMLTSYYFLFLGYSFIVNFIIILISSFTTFIISIFFVNRFYNKLSTYKNV